MYTEENEFDYNEYLNEAEEFDSNNKSSNKGLIIKILLIVLCLVIVIFLVFKIKNRNQDSSSKVDNSLIVFNNNIAILKSAGENYFFDNNNKPKEIGEEVSITISDLVDSKLVTDIKDYDGKTCGYNTSYLKMTRNKNDYMLRINLLCPSLENSVTYYYDLDNKCLNCNGESYTPSNEDTNVDNSTNNDSNNSTDNSSNNSPNQDSNTNTNINQDQNTATCGTYSAWTFEYRDDPSLVRESRVVVIGYKENITYGTWSDLTTTPSTANDNLEVQTEEVEETKVETTEWSSASTEKPTEQEGREIESWTEKTPYKKESCSTYTKTLTKWDNNALSCSIKSLGKVVCTYKTCTTKTKYKTTTYYKYQDTITTNVTTTYYKSREIYKNEPSYTDYILESEMPTGYQKLSGSEMTQYRYMEKCSK